MAPHLPHGVPLSPDYGADEQGDLIWVPIRVPRTSSRSPPTNNHNFYPTPPHMTNSSISDPCFASISWGQDSAMVATAGSYSGLVAGPTMDWSYSNLLPLGGELDAALELELQAYLDNQVLTREQMDIVGNSPDLFSGSDLADSLVGLSDVGLEFSSPGPLSSMGYGSPVEACIDASNFDSTHTWETSDFLYSPALSGSCSPAVSSSPMTCSTVSIPPTPVSPAFLIRPDVSADTPPSAIPCKARKRHNHNHRTAITPLAPHSRQRRGSPEGSSSGGGSFRCPLCNKTHLDNRALSRHLWAQHPDYASRTKTKSERAQCPMCEYSGRADNLARHVKRHAK